MIGQALFLGCALLASTCWGEELKHQDSAFHMQKQLAHKPMKEVEESKDRTTTQLIADPSGNVMAVWINQGKIEASVLPVKQTKWTAPVLIAKSEANLMDLKLACNEQGRFIVVWTESYENQKNCLLASFLSSVDGLWTTPRAISQLETRLSSPAIAINSKGKVIAAWEENTGALTVIKSTQYTLEKGWSSPKQLSSSDRNAINPCAAINDQGTGVVTWLRSAGNNLSSVLEAAVLPEDGEWIKPTDLNSSL